MNAQLETGAPSATSFQPITIVELRRLWLDHHEHVLRSSVATINRYRTATDHLLNFVAQQSSNKQASRFGVHDAEALVRYLRKLEVAPSRRAWVSPATYHPNEAWTLQQAQNLLMWLEEQGITATHLIHDRDTKFTRSLDGVLKSVGINVVKSPVMAPNANAFAESWIGSVRREYLNHFACFSLRHAVHFLQTFVRYYNGHRPHQGLGNRPLNHQADQLEEAGRVDPVGQIGCRSELGGLLKHYYRAAA